MYDLSLILFGSMIIGFLIRKRCCNQRKKRLLFNHNSTMTNSCLTSNVGINTFIPEDHPSLVYNQNDEFLSNIYKLYKTKEQEFMDQIKILEKMVSRDHGIIEEYKDQIASLRNDNSELQKTIESLRYDLNQQRSRKYYDNFLSVYVSATGRKLHHDPNCIKFTDKSSITLYPIDQKLYDIISNRFDIICTACTVYN